jgi:hypothetical protein
MERPLIKMDQNEANGMFQTFKGPIFSKTKELLEKFAPKHVRELVQHGDDDYRVVSFGSASIEKKLMIVKTIRCDREIIGWEVGYDNEDGERTIVKESNSWGAIAAEFVCLILRDLVRQASENRDIETGLELGQF